MNESTLVDPAGNPDGTSPERCLACSAGKPTEQLMTRGSSQESIGDSPLEPLVVGLLGITHPHASARVRALREIEGVEVVAAADDDSRLKYFTDKYDMEPRDIDALLQ